MENYFLWGSVGILVIFLLIGFFAGLIRGLKRSALHLVFFVISFVVAFFITKPITTAILGISITLNGTPTELNLIVYNLLSKNFDLQNYETAGEFLKSLPRAIVSPILFIVVAILTYFLFDIIYLIVARIWFKKKKADFSKNKPRRWLGSAVGVVEGFLFMFLIFAPLTSLTKTYEKIAYASTSTFEDVSAQEEQGKLQHISEYVKEYVPSTVDEIILSFNHSVIGQVSGAGGMNDALFDGLSSVKINDESIKLREEIVVAAETYDEFVDVYNNFTERNWEKIDLTDFKASVKKFLENGLFKGVVAQTVFDFVQNYQPSENLPEVLSGLITKIKESEKFQSTYEYLTHDINGLLDAADEIIKSDFIKDYEALTDTSLTGILRFVDSKADATKPLAEDVLDLYVVHDGFSKLVEFASQKLADFIENDDPERIIALNSGVDPDTIIDQLLEAVDKLLDLDEQISVADLISAEDKLDYIASLKDEEGKEEGSKIESALTLAGETFDYFADLDLLEVDGQSVFDNILATFGLELKGDVINDVKLDTYTKFFNHIKTPVKNAVKMDLLKLTKGDVDFKEVLDSILTELHKNTDLLQETLMPFYGMKALDLNNLVFDNVKTQLSENLKDVIDLSSLSDYDHWSFELSAMGEVLDCLNATTESAKLENNETYLDYLLKERGPEESFDIKNLLEIILDDKPDAEGEEDDLHKILRALLKSNIFKPMYQKMFDYLDGAVEDRTGVDPQTDFMSMIPAEERFAPKDENDEQRKAREKIIEDKTKLRDGAVDAIADMVKLIITLQDKEQMNLQTVGQLLDILRVNALNGGTKDGIFNNVFVNFIWYITGGEAPNESYAGHEPLDKAADIKELLIKNGIDLNNPYNENNNFAQAMKTADDVIALAKKLKDKLQNEGNPFTGDNIGEIVDKVDEVLSEFGDGKELADLLETTQEIVDKVGGSEEVLGDDVKQLITEKEDEISSKIEDLQYDDTVKDAIAKFLGVERKKQDP